MGYLARLDALDFNRSYGAAVARSRAILLTGQSSFRASRLAPAQAAFLRAVAPDGAEPLLSAFPFHPDFGRDEPLPALPAASARNSLQFVWSLYSPRFRSILARALQPIVSSTRDRLYIVTGSCGLQLLASAWPTLAIPQAVDIRVVALGPALIRPHNLNRRRVAVIQGHSDSFSRLLYRGPVTARCSAGHLEYWNSEEARRETARLFGAPVD